MYLTALILALCVFSVNAFSYTKNDCLMDKRFCERDLESCENVRDTCIANLDNCLSVKTTEQVSTTESSCCLAMDLLESELKTCIGRNETNVLLISELNERLSTCEYTVDTLKPVCHNLSETQDKLFDSQYELSELKIERDGLVLEKDILEKKLADMRPILLNCSLLEESYNADIDFEAELKVCESKRISLETEVQDFETVKLMLENVQIEKVSNSNVVGVFARFINKYDDLKIEKKGSDVYMSNCKLELSTFKGKALGCAQKLSIFEEDEKSYLEMLENYNLTALDLENNLEKEKIKNSACEVDLSMCKNNLSSCEDSLSIKVRECENVDNLLSIHRTKLNALEGKKSYL